MHKHEYAEICKKKYAEICKKYANICICPMSLPQLHIYAKICKKYAKYVSMKFICIICTSQAPTLLMWQWCQVNGNATETEAIGFERDTSATTGHCRSGIRSIRDINVCRAGCSQTTCPGHMIMKRTLSLLVHPGWKDFSWAQTTSCTVGWTSYL